MRSNFDKNDFWFLTITKDRKSFSYLESEKFINLFKDINPENKINHNLFKAGIKTIIFNIINKSPKKNQVLKIEYYIIEQLNHCKRSDLIEFKKYLQQINELVDSHPDKRVKKSKDKISDFNKKNHLQLQESNFLKFQRALKQKGTVYYLSHALILSTVLLLAYLNPSINFKTEILQFTLTAIASLSIIQIIQKSYKNYTSRTNNKKIKEQKIPSKDKLSQKSKKIKKKNQIDLKNSEQHQNSSIIVHKKIPDKIDPINSLKIIYKLKQPSHLIRNELQKIRKYNNKFYISLSYAITKKIDNLNDCIAIGNALQKCSQLPENITHEDQSFLTNLIEETKDKIAKYKNNKKKKPTIKKDSKEEKEIPIKILIPQEKELKKAQDNTKTKQTSHLNLLHRDQLRLISLSEKERESRKQKTDYFFKKLHNYFNDISLYNKTLKTSIKGSFLYQCYIKEKIIPHDIDLEIVVEKISCKKHKIQKYVSELLSININLIDKICAYTGKNNTNKDIQNIQCHLLLNLNHQHPPIEVTIYNQKYYNNGNKSWLASFDALRMNFTKSGYELNSCDNFQRITVSYDLLELLKNLEKGDYQLNKNNMQDNKKPIKYYQEKFLIQFPQLIQAMKEATPKTSIKPTYLDVPERKESKQK